MVLNSILTVLTTISPKFEGSPVSLSTTSWIPSGGFLTNACTSRPILAKVRGGKFSIEEEDPPLLDPLLYWRSKPEPAVDAIVTIEYLGDDLLPPRRLTDSLETDVVEREMSVVARRLKSRKSSPE